jgi:hypothetical protein
MCQFAEEHEMAIDRTLFAEHASYTRNALVMASAIYPDYAGFQNTDYLDKIVGDSLKRKRKES